MQYIKSGKVAFLQYQEILKNALLNITDLNVVNLIVDYINGISFNQAEDIIIWEGMYSHGVCSWIQLHIWLTDVGGFSFGHYDKGYTLDTIQDINDQQEMLDPKNSIIFMNAESINSRYFDLLTPYDKNESMSYAGDLEDIVDLLKTIKKVNHRKIIDIETLLNKRGVQVVNDNSFYCALDPYERDYWENPKYFYLRNASGLVEELNIIHEQYQQYQNSSY